MTRKKAGRLVKAPKKRENKVLNSLPPQKDADVSFIDTSAEELKGIENAEEFMDGLLKLKVKFLWEIQDWSKRFDISTDVRIYFTPKSGG